MRKLKINEEFIKELNLDLNIVKNYFELSPQEQVSFINDCFNKGIEQDQIVKCIGYSWTVITETIRPTYEKIKGFYQLKDENKVSLDTNNSYVSIKEFETLKQEIEELKGLLKGATNNNISNNLLLDVRHDICKDTITKQYKIDKNISEKFDKFAEDNCILNKQVLISTAIEQFLDRYIK